MSPTEPRESAVGAREPQPSASHHPSATHPSPGIAEHNAPPTIELASIELASIELGVSLEQVRTGAPKAERSSRADLGRADLSRADLSRADLSRADLSRADLSRADHAVLRERRRYRVLLSVALTSLVLSLGAVGLLGWGVYRWRSLLIRSEQVADEEGESSTKRANLTPEDTDDSDEDVRAEPPSLDDVVKDTHAEMIGNIEVVDLGASSGSLGDVLRAQRLVADTKNQTFVLMLTGRRCEPCRAFDNALEHPMMQRAMRDVRLVRVDLEVFKEEIKRLELPTNLYPAFFLLGDDLRPIDAIHGGEWDDDVAENIAPVIGPFLRGELKERRHYDWSPTTTSIPI